MARVTAAVLRDRAREAMMLAGGRGFVRFLPPGGALLSTDANRRCRGEEEKDALMAALQDADFDCAEQGGLLVLTPTDELLGSIVCGENVQIDWDSPLHPVQALGLRWMRKEKQRLSGAGRQLILEALRMSWQPIRNAEDCTQTLRAQGAVMLRCGDSSGMHEAGAILLEWCARQV